MDHAFLLLWSLKSCLHSWFHHNSTHRISLTLVWWISAVYRCVYSKLQAHCIVCDTHIFHKCVFLSLQIKFTSNRGSFLLTWLNVLVHKVFFRETFQSVRNFHIPCCTNHFRDLELWASAISRSPRWDWHHLGPLGWNLTWTQKPREGSREPSLHSIQTWLTLYFS